MTHTKCKSCGGHIYDKKSQTLGLCSFHRSPELLKKYCTKKQIEEVYGKKKVRK